MMPEKKYNNKLKQFGNAESYLEDSGILENGKVCVSQNVNELTFEQFVRSIRNGLGHWEETQGLGIEYKKNEEGLIDKIVINGSLTVKKEYKTSIEFDVTDTENVTKFLDLITKV